MKTTDYVLELLVTGLGTLSWMAVGGYLIVGHQYEIGRLEIIEQSSPWLILILLPFAYTLGVIVDRLLGNLSDGKLNGKKGINLAIWALFLSSPGYKSYKNKVTPYGPGNLKAAKGRPTLSEMRSRIYLRNSPVVTLFEYGKMRQRICRGWRFNGIILAITISLLPLVASLSLVLIASLVLAFLISSLFAGTAYFSLKKNEIKYLEIQNKLLDTTSIN